MRNRRSRWMAFAAMCLCLLSTVPFMPSTRHPSDTTAPSWLTANRSSPLGSIISLAVVSADLGDGAADAAWQALTQHFLDTDLPALSAAGFNVAIISSPYPHVWPTVERLDASNILTMTEVNKYAYTSGVIANSPHTSLIGNIGGDDFNFIDYPASQRADWTAPHTLVAQPPQEQGFLHDLNKQYAPNSLCMSCGVGYPPYNPPTPDANPDLFDYHSFAATCPDAGDGVPIGAEYYRDTLDVFINENYPIGILDFDMNIYIWQRHPAQTYTAEHIVLCRHVQAF